MFQVIKTVQYPAARVDLSRSKSLKRSPSCSEVIQEMIAGKEKYLTVFGGYMINFMIGGYVAVGNAIPYLASYLTASEMNFAVNSCTEMVASRLQSNLSICNWLMAAFTVGYAGFGALGGLMQLFCSTRIVTTLGGSLVFTSYFISSFYTDNVYVQLCCGFGVLYGIGCGIVWSPSIVCVIQWFPNIKSLLTGVLMSAMGLGAICLSMTETLYINPSDIKYDPVCGYTMYPEVIDKLPSTFLILVGISTFCTLCGYIFLFDKPTPGASVTDHHAMDDYQNSGKQKELEKFDVNLIADECDDSIDSEPMNYTVSEALRTVQFWIIFTNVLLGVFTVAFVYSDWKLFALQYLLIEDDSFLLSLNIGAATSGFLGRFFWGGMCDYIGSYGKTIMIVTAIECVAISTLPLCPVGNKVMAFIWICVLWFCVSASYLLFPPALSNQFGNKYCGILTGFTMISEIVATFAQSGFFSLLGSVIMNSRERWVLLCMEQSVFLAVSFVISMRFKDTARCKKYKGLER